ncbi:hypothetical protein P170DRAFT_38538 [Aspergillus steynii IBT 23096]|uniref:Uncharacterized protein n=1 Tax=Aspergillus steynii IBT 23096 TaxID=1392250 RepID=A0A2I2GR43_9EURO|nr:uncharacterized protein P170DRAFT_38538 [Aspergillus steynii IBT 23096]PLB55333.1 hypothetical protein P170DRAFT_38538 [Aspergillus steynii IBT 23096]
MARWALVSSWSWRTAHQEYRRLLSGTDPPDETTQICKIWRNGNCSLDFIFDERQFYIIIGLFLQPSDGSAFFLTKTNPICCRSQ